MAGRRGAVHGRLVRDPGGPALVVEEHHLLADGSLAQRARGHGDPFGERHREGRRPRGAVRAAFPAPASQRSDTPARRTHRVRLHVTRPRTSPRRRPRRDRHRTSARHRRRGHHRRPARRRNGSCRRRRASGVTARRVVIGRPSAARRSSRSRPVSRISRFVSSARTLGPDLRPSPLARTRLVPPGPVVLREPVGRGSLVVVIRCAMPATPVVAVPVRRAVPAATVLLRAFHPPLAVAVAIPGPVPTAGAPLVAGLVDARGFEQQRPHRPAAEPVPGANRRPPRPAPTGLPLVEGRGDLLRKGPVLARRGIPLHGSVAPRWCGCRWAVARRSAAVLWPRCGGVASHVSQGGVVPPPAVRQQPADRPVAERPERAPGPGAPAAHREPRASAPTSPGHPR